MKIYQLTIMWLCALIICGCGAKQPAVSPTETLKTFVEASKAKNVEVVKSNLSKGTLEMMEKNAQKQNTTVDELLRRDVGAPISNMPEMRNESIEGDTASLEVKSGASGEFDKIPFVKEDGAWKIAFDKFLEETKSKVRQNSQNKPRINLPANTDFSTGINSNSAVNK